MASLARGDVVLVRFPFSDLTSAKLIFVLSILGFGRALSATAIPPQVQSEIAWLSAEELALRGEAAIAELPRGDRLAAEGMLRSAGVLPAEDPEACDVVGKPTGLDEPVDVASKLKRDGYALLGRITEAEQGLAHGTPATRGGPAMTGGRTAAPFQHVRAPCTGSGPAPLPRLASKA